jgi:hypothetical protein
MKGLRDLKQIGDLSAHNRRFNARQNDIDRVRDGLRVAAEELLPWRDFLVIPLALRLPYPAPRPRVWRLPKFLLRRGGHIAGELTFLVRIFAPASPGCVRQF